MAPKNKNYNDKKSTEKKKRVSDELRSFCLQVLNLDDLERVNSLIDANHGRYNNSAVFHRVIASIKWYQSKTEEAIASARRATAISPANLDYSLFLAKLLIQYSDNYEEGCKECERALSLTNPVDIAPDERYGVINIEEYLSPETAEEARIALYQEQLQSLLVSTKVKLKKRIVRSYLESLTPAEMRSLLEIDVENLKGYDSGTILSEALQFVEANYSWKYWACPCCDQKFGDHVSHLTHVSKDHLPTLSQGRRSLFPKGVDQDWLDKIANGSWDPIDVNAAVKMLEERPDCDEWPISDNEERISLLKRIRAVFRMLVKYNYLSRFHHRALLNSFRRDIKAPLSTTQCLSRIMNKEPTVYFRILDASTLGTVLCYLQNLIDSCDLGKQSKKDRFFDIEVADVSDPELAVTILFYRNLSKLTLCPWGFSSSSTDDVSMRCMTDVDGFVSWLYEGLSLEESSVAWTELKKSRATQSKRIVHMLRKEQDRLVNLLDKKRAFVLYGDNLLQIEELCCDESKKRKNDRQSYEGVLRKKKEETEKELALLKEKRGVGLEPTALLDVISHVLEKAHEKESGDNLQDACISDVMRYLRTSKIIEVSFVDAKMMKILPESQQLEFMLGTASSLDYLKVLLPLMKSFLQKLIEEAAVKFAKKKSELTTEEVTTEIESDAKNSKDTGADHPTQTQDKSGLK